MGMWTDFTPRKLSKRDSEHPWVFAEYMETPSERDDGYWYTAFLFRDRDRTIFGIKEFFVFPPQPSVYELATRVVKDAAFRESLVSNDPDLPKIWKRH